MTRKSWQPTSQARRQRKMLPRGRFRPTSAVSDAPAILYGWHTVKAALENPARRIRHLLATEKRDAAAD